MIMSEEQTIKIMNNDEIRDVCLKKDYEIYLKDKEIERLKAREQECIDKYLAESKYRSEIEGKYVVDEYIINELEKYIVSEYYCFDNESLECEIAKNILDKLKELKEGVNNENNNI